MSVIENVLQKTAKYTWYAQQARSIEGNTHKIVKGTTDSPLVTPPFSGGQAVGA
jgi:hypothetical protein